MTGWHPVGACGASGPGHRMAAPRACASRPPQPSCVTDVFSTYMCCPPHITGLDPGISARLMHVACMTHMHLTTPPPPQH